MLVGHGAQAQQNFWPNWSANESNVKETPLSPSRPGDSGSLPAVSSLRGSPLGGRSEEFKQPDGGLPSGGERNLVPPAGELAPDSLTKGLAASAKGSAEASSPAGPARLPASSLSQEGAEAASVSGREPIRLGPVQKGRPLSGVSGSRFDPTASTLTVLSSLAVVLGVFLLLVWAIRRAMPRSSQLLPTDVVEVLGRAPLMGKQQMYLVRFGPKLLLLSVSPEGAETLTEIEHPDEVARIVALCRQNQPGSIPGAFRQILEQMSRQKSPAGALRRSGVLASEPAEQVESANLAQQEPAHV